MARMHASLRAEVDLDSMSRPGSLSHPRTQRWLLVCAVWLALSPSLAGAQTSASDKAMAEHLFDRGLALMRQGQFSEACTQLEQSEAIERGIGTLLYLAECYEKLGRTASAWAMF